MKTTKFSGFKITVFLLSLLIMFLSSCTKDELTKPAAVNFEFAMNTQLDQSKFLQFDQGDLLFSFIEFDGDRETGKDVFFISTFEQGVKADLDAKFTSEPTQFDIPQGVYKHIKLKIGNEISLAEPEITYTGIYKSIKNGDVPVRIEFDLNEPLEISAQASQGGNEIILKKDVPSIAEVFLDPIFLFQLSNSRQLESAEISTIDGQPVIVLSKDSNSVIFNILLNRLERSVSITFK